MLGSIDVWLVGINPIDTNGVNSLFVAIDGASQAVSNTTSTFLEDLDTSGWESPWNLRDDLASFRVNIDIVDLALGAAHHTIQVGTTAGFLGWMWTSETNGQSILETPTINTVTSNHPPDDLAFTLYDNLGNKPPVSAVPVPAAIWLFGTALIGLVGFSRKTKV